MFTARYELNIDVYFVLFIVLKPLESLEVQLRLYALPSIAGPYRDVEGSREITLAFTPRFEG